MTQQEALQILGLQPWASAHAIDNAYYALVAKQRPNEAAVRNLPQARDTLLRHAQVRAGGAAQHPHSSVPSIGSARPTTVAPSRPTTEPVATPAVQAQNTVRFLGLEKAYWRLLIRGSALLAV